MYTASLPRRVPTSIIPWLFALALFAPLFSRSDLLQIIPKQPAISKPTDSYDLTAWQVEVPGVFTYPVLQQPDDNAIYVTNKSGSLTQFQLPAQDGVTAVLAHNYLSGQDFYKLQLGQIVSVFYDNQKIERYRVTNIHRYQKIKPSSLQSDLLDLQTNQLLTTPEVYNQHYRGSHHLIFQTCLEGEGRLDWGLLFVIAEPVIEN